MSWVEGLLVLVLVLVLVAEEMILVLDLCILCYSQHQGPRIRYRSRVFRLLSIPTLPPQLLLLQLRVMALVTLVLALVVGEILEVDLAGTDMGTDTGTDMDMDLGPAR